MKKILLISSVIIGLSLSSCSKDPEDVLPRGDGKWSFTGSFASTNFSIPVSGSFTFNDDKTVVGTMVSGGQTESMSGKWSATETTVTLIDNSGSGNGNTTVFKVSDNTRSAQTWTYTETGADAGTITLKLTKD